MELADVKKHFENAKEVQDHAGDKGFVELEKFELSKAGRGSVIQNPFKKNWLVLWHPEKGFAKILTTKEPSFSITKDQLRQLTDPKVKEWFPEVFSLSEGFTGWVKCSENINKKWLTFFENGFQKYGFDIEGNWFTQISEVFLSGNEFEATEEEVFEALKNEAVKRGYKKGNFECVCGWNDNEFDGFSICEDFKLVSAKKHRGGKVLFHKGKWATIIPTITKYEAEKLLNKKIID